MGLKSAVRSTRIRAIALSVRISTLAEAMEAGGAGEPGGCACCGTGWKGGRNEERGKRGWIL